MKFSFNTRKAQVQLAIEDPDKSIRKLYYNKLLSLKTILQEEYLPEAVFEEHFILENGKEIACVYVELPNVNIHNKATWQQTMVFLNHTMQQFEIFWAEYKDIIQEEK